MKPRKRRRYLLRAPRIAWDVLARGRYEFTFDHMPIRASGMSLRKRINTLRAGLNLLHMRDKPWSWPIHMQFELVNYCNLSCPVCPTGVGMLERRPQAMDMGLMRRVMEEAGPYLLTTALWAWGEPLLHPEFDEAVRIARQYGVGPRISTNGQNLNEPRVLEGLASSPPDILIVALDGLSDETFSANRPGASLEPALEGVRRLQELRRERGTDLPLLHMRFIVTSENEHEVPDVLDFARKHGFDMVSFRSLSIIDADETEHRRKVPQSAEHRAYDYTAEERVRHSDFLCDMAVCYPAVLADGTVLACDQDYNAHHAYGRVGEDGSFADIWFGRKAEAVRKIIRTDRQRFSFCRNCPFADRAVRTCSFRFHDLRQLPSTPDAAPPTGSSERAPTV
jgi:radical SAM protein with 4Fe4S-binding SPASM domain